MTFARLNKMVTDYEGEPRQTSVNGGIREALWAMAK